QFPHARSPADVEPRPQRLPLRERHAERLFFFHAEDGIRFRNVTGVQTCALPIWWHSIGLARPEPKTGWNATPAMKSVARAYSAIDRKSVVKGKSVGSGGRRTLRKKTTPTSGRKDMQATLHASM